MQMNVANVMDIDFNEQQNASPWEICSHARELYTSIYFVNLNKMLLWAGGRGGGEGLGGGS